MSYKRCIQLYEQRYTVSLTHSYLSHNITSSCKTFKKDNYNRASIIIL